MLGARDDVCDIESGVAGDFEDRAESVSREPVRILHPDRVTERVEPVRLEQKCFANLDVRRGGRHEEGAELSGPLTAKGVDGAVEVLEPDPAPLDRWRGHRREGDQGICVDDLPRGRLEGPELAVPGGWVQVPVRESRG